MKRTTRNEASFSEVFWFAEEKFGHSWNTCCDIFHGSEFFNYKDIDDFELEELEACAADPDDYYQGENFTLARQIMIAYMKEHKVKKCRIDNR